MVRRGPVWSHIPVQNFQKREKEFRKDRIKATIQENFLELKLQDPMLKSNSWRAKNTDEKRCTSRNVMVKFLSTNKREDSTCFYLIKESKSRMIWLFKATSESGRYISAFKTLRKNAPSLIQNFISSQTWVKFEGRIQILSEELAIKKCPNKQPFLEKLLEDTVHQYQRISQDRI